MSEDFKKAIKREAEEYRQWLERGETDLIPMTRGKQAISEFENLVLAEYDKAKTEWKQVVNFYRDKSRKLGKEKIEQKQKLQQAFDDFPHSLPIELVKKDQWVFLSSEIEKWRDKKKHELELKLKKEGIDHEDDY